jgi:hypothetical protein
MLLEHIVLIERIGLDLFFAVIFLLIGLAIRDIIKNSNIPPFGKFVVWLVLFLGCIGFIVKGIIQIILES